MAQDVVPVLRSVCSWCLKVIRQGVEPTSHGICAACSNEQRAKIHAAAVAKRRKEQPVPPIVVQPTDLRSYEVLDSTGRLLAQGFTAREAPSALNRATAVAHIINNAIAGNGVCLAHLSELRQDGTCFSCSIGVHPSMYAVVSR